MIVFVGDQPSKKNIDPNIPFVGTQSYKRLLEWIWEMNIDISEVKLLNKDSLYRFMHNDFHVRPRIISLGKNAEKVAKVYGGLHFNLPHPSGLNRQNNDKEFIKQKLKECKEWLES